MPAPRRRNSELDVIGIPREMKPAAAVLRGRLAEALGHEGTRSTTTVSRLTRPTAQAAAEAKLLELILRQKRDEISQADTLRELESLSVIWRGDGDRGEDAADVGADLFRHRALRGSLCGGADRDPAAAQFRSLASGAGRGGGAVHPTLPEPEGDDSRRSTRSGCSTNFAN